MTLVVVTGVGTGIGKTHFAAALVRAWGRHEPALGYKPIESGVVGAVGDDEAALATVSTFHVKPSLPQIRLRAPVSPHLAARMDGVSVPVDDIVRAVTRIRGEASVILELPGGLFSPLSETTTNADLATTLAPEVLLLVAPNRLGVLHDVRAAFEACLARRLAVTGVVLSATPFEDASASTNPVELPVLVGLPLLANLCRASVDEIVASGALDDLVAYCRARPRQVPALEDPGRAP